MRRVDARRIASDLKQLDRALAVKTEDGALIELLRGMVSEAVSTAEKIDP